MLRSPRLALALCAFLSLVACGDSTGPDRKKVGELRFSYAGAHSGRFDAVGSAGLLASERKEWAVGLRETGPEADGSVLVMANVPVSGDRSDAVWLTLEGPVVGARSCTAEETECPFGMMFFRRTAIRDPEAPEDPEAALYFSRAGSLRITEVSERRIRGEFSFELSEGFGLLPDGTERRVQVQSGVFDVPLLTVRG